MNSSGRLCSSDNGAALCCFTEDHPPPCGFTRKREPESVPVHIEAMPMSGSAIVELPAGLSVGSVVEVHHAGGGSLRVSPIDAPAHPYREGPAADRPDPADVDPGTLYRQTDGAKRVFVMAKPGQLPPWPPAVPSRQTFARPGSNWAEDRSTWPSA